MIQSLREKQRPAPVRFSGSNLPRSEEVASARIHELNAEIASVGSKLTNANSKNFESISAYEDWRSRAGIRLNRSQEEKNFLERWLW